MSLNGLKDAKNVVKIEKTMLERIVEKLSMESQ
jgi:hypothetical protein